ncbi:unnamed protein product [Dovyalis caffra]|uniref:RING-type E3 ubiquitin transferase n=1 Tax=Dovyalis caffra TaxID=77055 RepID=A0AAV1RGZ7_9ROSI|nr:unnamed protein product [Dovyalis caffra]
MQNYVKSSWDFSELTALITDAIGRSSMSSKKDLMPKRVGALRTLDSFSLADDLCHLPLILLVIPVTLILVPMQFNIQALHLPKILFPAVAQWGCCGEMFASFACLRSCNQGIWAKSGAYVLLRFANLYLNYGAMFHRLEGRTVSPTQGGTSLATTGVGTGSLDGSANDTQISSSRPAPYDTDQRNGVDSEDDKLGYSESSEKSLATKVAYGLTYAQPPSEDEDVCPTCLDEYTPENPKITTRCSHHFHLGCIYEWLERSESCPICGKVR